MYYGKLTGFHLYSVSTEALRDRPLVDADTACTVRNECM